MCYYHGQLLSVAGRNTINAVFSEITLIAHEHDGDIFLGHVLRKRHKHKQLSLQSYE